MNNDALFYIPKAIVPKITVTSGCAVSCNVWVITDFIRTCHQCTCFQLAYCHLGSLIFLLQRIPGAERDEDKRAEDGF